MLIYINTLSGARKCHFDPPASETPRPLHRTTTPYTRTYTRIIWHAMRDVVRGRYCSGSALYSFPPKIRFYRFCKNEKKVRPLFSAKTVSFKVWFQKHFYLYVRKYIYKWVLTKQRWNISSVRFIRKIIKFESVTKNRFFPSFTSYELYLKMILDQCIYITMYDNW